MEATVTAVLADTRTHTGKTLQDLAREQSLLLVLLRHLG
jgi:hypothetical protein